MYMFKKKHFIVVCHSDLCTEQLKCYSVHKCEMVSSCCHSKTRVIVLNRLCDDYSMVDYSNNIQGNLRKGFGRCCLSCLLHYIHYLSIPLHTNSRDDIFQTLLVNSPVG